MKAIDRPAFARVIARTAVRAAFICALAVFLCLSFGCADDEQRNTLVKSFDERKSVTLSFFSTQVDASIWPQNITSTDGTEINIVVDKAEYYAAEGQGEAYRDFIESRLHDNSADMYIIAAEDVIDFDEQGFWQDLTGLEAVSNLSKDALMQSTYDGKVFSIPLSYTGFGFYWNKNVLDAHELAIPTNLDEFLNVCEQLKSAGITPYAGNKGYALTAPAMAVGFADLYAADNSEQLLADLSDGTTPVSTYMDQGFKFIEMMVEKGYLDPQQALDTTPGEGDYETLLAGDAAFICSSLGRLPIQDADIPIVATGLPLLANGSVSIVGADSRVAVNPNGKTVSYALEALDSLATPENLKTIALESECLSPLANNDVDYLGKENEELAKTVLSGNQIPNQDFRLHFNTWVNIRDLCQEMIKGTPSHDVIEHYDKLQQDEIALYG